MWRVLVSMVSVVFSALAARTFSRPGPPLATQTRVKGMRSTVAQEVERTSQPDDRDPRLSAITPEGPPVPRPEEALLPGWTRPRPAVVPRPTYWPVVLALGIALLLWGVITTAYLAATGLAIGVIGAGGWIAELLYESR